MAVCANRGKTTEKKVESALKIFNNMGSMSYLRFPDSRSARNFFSAQPSDFLVVSKGVPIFLEVKHLENPKRLPKGNLPQHATLNKFGHAGAQAILLVEHEGLGWRVVNVPDLATDVPSWDLSEVPLFDSAEAALKSTGLFA